MSSAIRKDKLMELSLGSGRGGKPPWEPFTEQWIWVPEPIAKIVHLDPELFWPRRGVTHPGVSSLALLGLGSSSWLNSGDLWGSVTPEVVCRPEIVLGDGASLFITGRVILKAGAKFHWAAG